MDSKQLAIRRDEEGKCVIETCEETSRRTRGLCTKHYEQFRRKKDSLSAEAAAEWENELIAAGKLLPNRQGSRTVDDAFADDFQAFLARNPGASKLKPVEEAKENAAKHIEKAKKKLKEFRESKKNVEE